MKIIAVILGIFWATCAYAQGLPSNLQTRVNRGQTFLTWTEVAGAPSYSVYRSTSPITTVTGLTPVATVPQNSGLNLYTNQRFVIADLAPPIASGTAFVVYTDRATENAYYAVTVTGNTVIQPGVNTTTTPTAEVVANPPGAVLIQGSHDCGGAGAGYTCYSYMAWEDVTTWNQTAWGYYGRRFDVALATDGLTAPYPLFLDLHGAGLDGYQEPPVYIDTAWNGIFVFPMDLDFSCAPDCAPPVASDPYATAVGGAYQPTAWFGYDQPGAPELARSATEQRVVRYARLVAADQQTYQIDQNRIYVKGGSMGGGGALHVGMHHPELFAAIASSLTWIAPYDWGDWSAFSYNPDPPINLGPPVDSPSGAVFGNYLDDEWQAAQTGPFPPVVYTYASDDDIIPPAHFRSYLPTLETNKRAYIAHWQTGGHYIYWLDAAGDAASVTRFRKNEAYPAFANASNSDPTSVSEGQRNQNLDWYSSLHPLPSGTAIADTSSSFGMSFQSLTTDVTADVTVLNTQAFHPTSNVQWTNQVNGVTVQSGTVPVGAQGRVTIPGLQIKTAGNRLTLTTT